MNSQIEFLTQKEVKKFIRENINADPNKLILNPPTQFKDHVKLIANQILARQKAKGKLDSWYENFNLIMPPPLSIEQASSESTCRYKKDLIKGEHLIDLTGGMGIDCLALSESFDKSTYVEKENELCEIFRHNSSILDQRIEIVNSNAEDFLEHANLDFEKTTIYIDPARRDDVKNRVFRIEDCTPNLIELLPILEKFKSILIKFSPILDIQAVLSKIPNISELHIVSVKNDCKEVLVLRGNDKITSPVIHCTNLESKQSPYSFSLIEERSAQSELGDLASYIYEPNSSIMKAGAFNKIAIDFQLKKLDINTHLYTSDKQIKDFPGRMFKVIEPVNKKSITRYAPKGKINVITRNHPLNATDLKKKWGLKDGGEYYLIAFRDKTNKAQAIVATRIDL